MKDKHTAFICHFLEAANLKLGPTEIEPDTEFAKLPGWDSLAIVGIMIMADLEYGAKITVNQVNSCRTIEELYLLCSSN